MIPENYKTFLNISDKQLPRFIAGDPAYQNFVSFIETYYSWLAENNNIEDRSKNLLNYIDIDSTLDDFEKYFYSQFLPYFPAEVLSDKRELIKYSKELYRRKSTRDAFKFLFRVLYNADADLYNTRESILIASDGKWVQSIYVKLDTLDNRFLKCKGYKIFGETSKSIAVIQNVHIITGEVQVLISDISSSFISGETVKILDNRLNDLYFDANGDVTDSSSGTLLQAKIKALLSDLTIDPNNYGYTYDVGDPVVFYGGDLDTRSTDTYHAVGEVTGVTKGKINSITIEYPSNGFSTFPNTILTITGKGAANANAIVSAVDTNSVAVISITGSQIISPYSNVYINAASYGFTYNPSANANTTIINALGTININTYPISEITLISEGDGFKEIPTIDAKSYYDGILISEFGVLSPMEITFGGYNYSNNDVININGGAGTGAYANVKSVDANGTIKEVQYIQLSSSYPIGGIGYNMEGLPSASIVSTNNKIVYANTTTETGAGGLILNLANTSNIKTGMYVSGNGIPYVTTLDYFESNVRVTFVDSPNNIVYLDSALESTAPINSLYKFDGTALLNVPSILGDGEILVANTELGGSITSLQILDQGFGYSSTPNVSLKVVDIAVTMEYGTNSNPPVGSRVYQSVNESAINGVNFIGFVADYQVISGQLHYLRVYNYNGSVNSVVDVKPLYIDITVANSKEYKFNLYNEYNTNDYENGVKIYGDGQAKANVSFSGGVVKAEGKFLNTDGFLSSDKVLQSMIYNDFTYFVTIEKEFSKYKDIVKNILHPGGNQLIGRYSLKSNSPIVTSTESYLYDKIDLKYLLKDYDLYGEFVSDNEFQLYDKTSLISLSDVITVNNYINIVSYNNESYSGKIKSIDDANNIISFYDYRFLNLANVAYGYTNSNSVIVTQLTKQYDLINNGNYSNANNHLVDIVFVGDKISIGDNEEIVITNVDYDVNSWTIYTDTTLTPSGNSDNPSLITINKTYTSSIIIVDYKYYYSNGYYIMIGSDYLTDSSNSIIYIP